MRTWLLATFLLCAGPAWSQTQPGTPDDAAARFDRMSEQEKADICLKVFSMAFGSVLARLENLTRRSCSAAHIRASPSMSISRRTARLSTARRAISVARVSCQSGLARPIDRAARSIG